MEVATEKVEEVTSEKSANVEWSSDDQTPQELVTGSNLTELKADTFYHFPHTPPHSEKKMFYCFIQAGQPS